MNAKLNAKFEDDEKLYRAVLPRNLYWKHGKLTSAAFKDENGLSVDRAGKRDTKSCVQSMRAKLRGSVVSVTAKDCKQVNALIKYCPSKNNAFHSEIHNSKSEITLSASQMYHLAQKAIIEFKPASGE